MEVFFVLSPKIFRYIKNDRSIFEREVLEELSKKLLSAFKHKIFGMRWINYLIRIPQSIMG